MKSEENRRFIFLITSIDVVNVCMIIIYTITII